jgi:hypothetical protein
MIPVKASRNNTPIQKVVKGIRSARQNYFTDRVKGKQTLLSGRSCQQPSRFFECFNGDISKSLHKWQPCSSSAIALIDLFDDFVQGVPHDD